MNVEQGWIEWNGGECPVDPAQRVHVRMRAYSAQITAVRAGTYRWWHGPAGDPHDIIAYRIVEPGK